MRVFSFVMCENAWMALGWEDIRTVQALVRAGSLSGAGQALGLNYTTVSRRIDRAEAALSETLFERLADGYRPTNAALLIARHAAAMEEADHALMRELAGRDDRLTGGLTITAPQLLIAHVLSPALARFSDLHPGVDLRIRATNDLLDLSRREADLAIRVSRSPGDTLTGLRLTDQHSASFAHPEWAARIADDPGGAIDWIVYEGFPDLPEPVLRGWPGSRVRYRMDDMVAMLGAAEAGLGVVRMPLFLGRASERLVPVPLIPATPYPEIWLVGHADVWPGAKPRAFRDVLQPFFRDIRHRFTDDTPTA